jgi:hypothetical protein
VAHFVDDLALRPPMPVLPTVVALLIHMLLLRALSLIVTVLAAGVAKALLELVKVMVLLLNWRFRRIRVVTRRVWCRPVLLVSLAKVPCVGQLTQGE